MADETPPMTDERLAKIRRRVAADVTLVGTLIPPWELAGMIDELANEVDRLRAREATAMAIVRDVAAYKGGLVDEVYEPEEWLCEFCGATTPLRDHMQVEQHTPDCPVTRARALLTQE